MATPKNHKNKRTGIEVHKYSGGNRVIRHNGGEESSRRLPGGEAVENDPHLEVAFPADVLRKARDLIRGVKVDITVPLVGEE